MAAMRHNRRPSLLDIGFSLHVVLVLAFDYVPESLRLGISGVLFVIYGVCAFRYSRRDRSAYYNFCMLMLSVLVAAWAVSYAFIPHVQTNPDVSLSEAIRELAPMLALIAYVVGSARIRQKTLLFWCFVLLASAVGHALLLPNVYLTPSYRLAPFSSGMHTSAYVVASISICIWNIRSNSKVYGFVRIMMWGACVALLFGYGVRTAQLLLLVYFFLEFCRLVILPRFGTMFSLSLVVSAILTVFPVSLAVIYFLYGFDQLSTFTSGRLANYIQRFDLIGERDLLQFLLGTGPGSDRLVTDVWWWEEKDSHNDLIHLLWVGGALSLCALFGLLYATWKIERRHFSAFVVALLLTSASSNALLARPNAAFLFFAAMAVSVSRPLRNSVGAHPKSIVPRGSPPDGSPSHSCMDNTAKV